LPLHLASQHSLRWFTCAAQAAALAALLVAPAHAASTINLRWDACLGDGGVANKSFACDTNVGTERLLGSFVPPMDMFGTTGSEIAVDLGTFGPALPAWWTFKNVGTCRQSSLAINAVVPATAVACVDWASGQATAILVAYIPLTSSSARITAVTTLPLPLLEGPIAGTENYAFTLTINHLKTVGTGACAGCDVPMCIALRQITIKNEPPQGSVLLAIGRQPSDKLSDSFVLWQAPPGQTSCAHSVPARNRTWGEVKSLYR
jgi:hypothetical protein